MLSVADSLKEDFRCFYFDSLMLIYLKNLLGWSTNGGRGAKNDGRRRDLEFDSIEDSISSIESKLLCALPGEE